MFTILNPKKWIPGNIEARQVKVHEKGGLHAEARLLKFNSTDQQMNNR